MSIKFLIRVVTVILSLPIIAPAIASGDNCLEVRIWADKTHYCRLEPIVIHYETKNPGPSPIATIFMEFAAYFIINDQNGKVYPNCQSGFFVMAADTLYPGHSTTDYEEIDARYKVHAPGIYTCYMELSKNIVYPECGCKMKSDDVVDDKTELIKICHTLIEDYSDSPYVKWTFLHLYEFHKEIGDKAGAMEYMEYLLDKYPDNETISERAGFWLEKIKKEEF